MKRLILALPLSLLLLAGSTLAAGSSLLTGWSWIPPTAGRHVGVVGDSLVYQAEHGSDPDLYYQRHYLTDQLTAAGWFTRIAAASGRTTDALRMWGQWATPPEVIVMALGTNDNYYSIPPATSVNNIRTYLARWPNACTVYVGVVPSVPRGIDDTAPAWNVWLEAEAVRTGGVYVDWPAISAPHPEWFVADQLHQTPGPTGGQAAYRNAITEGVQRCQ